MAARVEVVGGDLVPVALDQRGFAVRAEGGAARAVVNVAGVNVMQAGIECDLARALQRRGRRGGQIVELPVGMKGGEVQWHVGTEFAACPIHQGLDFRIAVVQCRDQQRGDLEPGMSLAFQVDQGVEYGLQPTGAVFDIEVVGKTLQIHIRGVHAGVELDHRFPVEIAGGHRDGLYAEPAAGGGGVERVFGEDDRVVVGESDALAAQVFGDLGDLFRAGRFHQPVHVLRFRDIPVLAELAGQVAAGGAEREHGTAGVEMVERFLLDRVDAEA